MARPRKLTNAQRKEVYEALELYIQRSPDPTIVGFEAYDPVALKYDVTEDNLQDWTEFSNLRKKAVRKQEAYLLYGATRNQINTIMAIFRLKQPAHGYKDRQEVDQKTEHSGGITVNVTKFGGNDE